MKALLSFAAGGPRTLRLAEVAEPEPAAGQVRIAVRCCAVGYPDLLLIQDKYQLKPPRPFAPGSEVAGVIDSLGPGIGDFRVGDSVVAMTGLGGMAELALADAHSCFRVPSSMPWPEAATFLTAYSTSYYALKHCGRLNEGETLLVLGAAGGVGLAAVELGKVFGARVIAAVSSSGKAKVAAEHGADEVLIYPAQVMDTSSLGKAFKEACAPGGANVIYDAVGGSYSESALRSIAWNGRFLVVGFPAGIASIPLNLPLLKGCSIVGVYLGAHARLEREAFRNDVSELMLLFAQNRLRPLVSETFPLEQGAEAISRLAERTAMGRVVVTMPALSHTA
jgi:NADPH:quinone reductase-like Zn-dependent oxidoreductase